MTATTLQKYRKLLHDDKGKPVMVQLNLRNKMMREAYEKTMEEIEDALDVKEAIRRDDGDTITWEEFKASLYVKLDKK